MLNHQEHDNNYCKGRLGNLRHFLFNRIMFNSVNHRNTLRGNAKFVVFRRGGSSSLTGNIPLKNKPFLKENKPTKCQFFKAYSKCLHINGFYETLSILLTSPLSLFSISSNTHFDIDANNIFRVESWANIVYV